MSRLRRLAPTSMRARATLAATVLFAVALTIAAAALVAVLRSTMTDNVDTTLALRATDIAGLLAVGADPASVAIVDEEDSFVQVVVGDEVVASSVNVAGEGPIVDLLPGEVVTERGGPLDGAFRVIETRVETPTGPARVIVGNALEDVVRTVEVTLLTLALGMPVLLLLAGAMTWIVVGRSLRSVEAIRAEVAEIGASGLHRRVPTPPGDDEIVRLAGTMNDMLDRIESGTMRQRRFVSDASHELRTPIATIRHELEVALAHSADTDWALIAGEVLDEDLRMQRLVDDLLWLARHDSEGPRLRATLVDLDEVVLLQLRRQPPRPGVSIDAKGVSAGQVRGRADDLTRVVQNLLDNAIRHASGHVVVGVRSEGGAVQFHVDDDGPGVDPELRASIFERFTRSDEARDRDHGGAGLGLSIVAEIVDEHGGAVTVGESPLGGARFTVDLPDARRD